MNIQKRDLLKVIIVGSALLFVVWQFYKIRHSESPENGKSVSVTTPIPTYHPLSDVRTKAISQIREGDLKNGDAAPTLEIMSLEGKSFRLKELFGEKPTILIFGSFT